MTDRSTLGLSAVRRRICAVVMSGVVLSISAAAFAAPAPNVTSMPLSSLVVPKNITYWEMFANATAVVKFVMILLLAASVVSWTIWFSKYYDLRSAKRRLVADVRAMNTSANMEAVGAVKHGAAAEMLQVARAELSRVGTIRTSAAGEGVKERVVARLINIESSSIERMMRGTVVLATIGAIAPFVGLFGTVWGIMNSFIGISQSNTTNLAVVAPGIAEALLATAMGLVAAIPAVVMYNGVARTIAGFRRLLSEASTHVACLVSLEVDERIGRDSPSVRAA